MTDGPFYVAFYFNGHSVKLSTPDHERWSLEDIQRGFWITQDQAMCRESQGHFWIPPSMIMLIERRE